MIPPRIAAVFDSVRTPDDGNGPVNALRMTAAWRLRERSAYYFVWPVVFTLIHINVLVTGAAKLAFGQRVRSRLGGQRLYADFFRRRA
jgi:hypothetical protein